MAGKSNKNRNRKSSTSSVASSEPPTISDPPPKDNASISEPVKEETSQQLPAEENSTTAKTGTKESEAENSEGQLKQGDPNIYTVPVKTLTGEKLELQLNPGDSVIDIRQFLLEAPETCYITCYDLLLHTKDGSTHQLEDYNEISEVADITTGGCSLEMVAALYDDRSIRAHLHRTRELLTLSSLHSSLSTSLALQHEASKSKEHEAPKSKEHEAPKSKDAEKKDKNSVLNGLGFMEDITGSLSKLIQSSSTEVKCIESIVFSSFNPPPTHRRLVGDLMYLDVVTLEGNKFCITGTTRMFYVNSSTGNILDPRAGKASSEAVTLIGLLNKISSRFKKAFREILERKASAHPFENAQCPLAPNSWLDLHPIPDHKRDSARAEEALTLSFGSELIGMQRDWNEELQSCKEFPHSNPQERILRDRALYKVTTDFVEAAISGAIGVISRCIPPINPTDPECFHMYVHNNIFFSFAVDTDVDQLSRKGASETNSKTESMPSPQKSSSVSSKGDSQTPHEEKSDVVTEPQLAESEQATYASSNNDLKGTKAYQEADVPGLYNLAMAIIDYRGHRVVAQSVLPGILQGDKSDSLLYGSIDNGKKICWNEDFHSKVVEAAKRLHLKEHTVIDGSGKTFKLAAPVECKGIVGSDDRHYLLDLMRVTPRDANYTGAGSRFCILRPELITAFCQEKAKSEEASKLKSKSEDGEVQVAIDSLKDSSTEEKDAANPNSEGAVDGNSNYTTEILFNPNVFTDFKLAGSPEEIAADENNVKKASSYLLDVVLPKFVQELCTLEVSPMDGQTLTEALHAHGINMRYIGKVANGTKHLRHLWDLCCSEIVARSAKHIIKDILRETEDHDLGPAIAHFLNCFFGDCQAIGPKSSAHSVPSKSKKENGGHQSSGKAAKGQAKGKGRTNMRKNQPLYMNLSSEVLWSDIQEFAKLKYQFELPDDARKQVKKVSVLRSLCQKVGIAVAARKYDLEATLPFQTSDVLNLQPVVKHSIPLCSDAKELVETGKVQLAEGMLSEAYTLFSEAFTILQQVTGPMHREVANCCRYLAMVLYHAGDMAGAIMQQHKELIINERCLGLDHPDTAHSYGNMALFYHGLNQTELALQHMSRALLLLSLSSGPDHPDVAATFINVAMMYQDISNMNTALRYLQEALNKNKTLLGEEHIQTAVCYHALAIAFNCMGNFRLSYQHEKSTYEILLKQLGEEDSRTQDSLNWMKTFKMRDNQVTAQKQKGQEDAANAQKAIDLLKGNPELLQAFQVAAAARAAGGSSNTSAVVGDNLPRGRGVNERSARAVAEARKKAAARGVFLRNHGLPQTSASFAQILNAINSGVVSAAVPNVESSEAKQEIVDERPPESSETKDGSGSDKDKAPVGLGTSLKNKKPTKPAA